MSTDSVLIWEFVHIFRNLFVVYNFHVVNDVWGIVDTSNKDISDMLDVSLEKRGFLGEWMNLYLEAVNGGEVWYGKS